MKKFVFPILLVICIGTKTFAQPTIKLSTFATGFNSPIGIENCGDSRMFVVQQRGKIMICAAISTNNFSVAGLGCNCTSTFFKKLNPLLAQLKVLTLKVMLVSLMAESFVTIQ